MCGITLSGIAKFCSICKAQRVQIEFQTRFKEKAAQPQSENYLLKGAVINGFLIHANSCCRVGRQIQETVNATMFNVGDGNGIWYLIGAALVFFMQCGFAMVETGFTRAKNAGNIIMKNLMDFCSVRLHLYFSASV